jgi:hypothetical protein
MKVFTITLGYVEHSEVEALFKEEAIAIGYPSLLEQKAYLEDRIARASDSDPVDLADEVELEEVNFMLKVFQDEEGFAKDDIPF